MMKKIILILLVALMTISCRAQVININAVLRANKSSGSWVIEYDSTGLGSWRPIPSKGYVDGIAGTDVSAALGLKVNYTDTSFMLSNYAKLSALLNHTNNTSNPHNVTKAQVGLSNVDNTSDVNKPISTATQSTLNGKVDNTRQVNGHALTSDVSLTKSDVGLANVDNTSDVNKPVSTAQQNALNTKVDKIIGKKLSTNDYSNADSSKLASIGTTFDSVVVKTPFRQDQVVIGGQTYNRLYLNVVSSVDSGYMTPDMLTKLNIAYSGSGGGVANGNLPYIVATQYGLDNTGTLNNMPRLQAIIDSLEAIGDHHQGGRIYFPHGHYKFYLTTPATDRFGYRILIARSNIQLIGEDKYNTFLDFRGTGDTNPQTNYDTFNSSEFGFNIAVRSTGIMIQEVSNTDSIKGVVIQGLTLNGGCYAPSFNNNYPTTPSNPNQWDLSNKGIQIWGDGGNNLVELHVWDCNIVNFMGELIWAGGNSPGIIDVEHCHLKNSNASAYSCSGETRFMFNEVDSAINGGECYPGPHGALVSGNYFHDLTNTNANANGWVWGGAIATAKEAQPAIITDNIFRKIQGSGVLLIRSIRNGKVSGNYMEDCGSGVYVQPYDGYVYDFAIEHNTIIAQHVNGIKGIQFEGTAVDNVYVMNNVTGTSKTADSAVVMGQSLVYDQLAGRIVVKNNIWDGKNYLPQAGSTSGMVMYPLQQGNLWRGDVYCPAGLLVYNAAAHTVLAEPLDRQDWGAPLDTDTSYYDATFPVAKMQPGTEVSFKNTNAHTLYRLSAANTTVYSLQTDVIVKPGESVYLLNNDGGKLTLAKPKQRPTLTQAQRLALLTPTVGFEVYQTDGTSGLYVWKSDATWHFAY